MGALLDLGTQNKLARERYWKRTASDVLTRCAGKPELVRWLSPKGAKPER